MWDDVTGKIWSHGFVCGEVQRAGGDPYDLGVFRYATLLDWY